MDVLPIIVAFAFIGMMIERRDRKTIFPPQICLLCPEAIYFNFGQRIWLHADGQQYKPSPRVSLDHPALPSHVNYEEDTEQWT